MGFDPSQMAGLVARLATPEVGVVLGALGVGWAAWRVGRWAARGLAGLLRYLALVPVLLGVLFVGGAGAIGFGIGGCAQWIALPDPACAGLNAFDRQAFDILRRRDNEDALAAVVKYAVAAGDRPRAIVSATPSPSPAEPPLLPLPVSSALIGAGLGLCAVSLSTALFRNL